VSEFPVQVTIKGPASVASNAPWLNFQGQTVAMRWRSQLLEVFPDTTYDSFAELVSKAYVEYGAVLTAVVGLAAPAAPQAASIQSAGPAPVGRCCARSGQRRASCAPVPARREGLPLGCRARTGPGRPGSAPRPRARPVSARRSSSDGGDHRARDRRHPDPQDCPVGWSVALWAKKLRACREVLAERFTTMRRVWGVVTPGRVAWMWH
jgi:hypothetical protein